MSDAEHEDEGPAERAGGLPPASEKQLNFIASLQRKVGLSDADLAEVLDEVAGKNALEDLTIREASELIDELQTQAREKGVDVTPRATDKQKGFIKTLKRRAHLTDAEFGALLQDRAGVSELDQLGRREASGLIDHLLEVANAEKAGKPRPKPAAAAPAPPPPSYSEPEEPLDDEPPF